VKRVVGGDGRTYERAAQIVQDMVCDSAFVEFLTLPLYEQLDSAAGACEEKQDAYA